MPLPVAALYAGGAGLNLVGKIIANRSEQQRAARLRQQMLGALGPYEGALQAYELAPTQNEGYMMAEALDQASRALASRGLGQSSFVGQGAARAIAPIGAMREQNIFQRLSDLAAQKQAIYAGTSAPGTGAAIGGFLGEAGGLLTQMGGQADATSQIEQLIMQLRGGGGSQGFDMPAAPTPPGIQFGGATMQPGYGGGVPTGPSTDEDLIGLILGFREGAQVYGRR